MRENLYRTQRLKGSPKVSQSCQAYHNYVAHMYIRTCVYTHRAVKRENKAMVEIIVAANRKWGSGKSYERDSRERKKERWLIEETSKHFSSGNIVDSSAEVGLCRAAA